MKLYVALVGSQNSGNIGAVARVMKNFGFENIVLVNPQCNYNDYNANARAMHGKELLEKIEVVSELWNKFDYYIGTTAIVGGDDNIKRCPLTPEELGLKLKNIDSETTVCIVFGREDSGLLNEELERCDFTVTISSASDYPTLNLSHAVAVILYELYKIFGSESVGKDIKPIDAKSKEILLNMIFEKLDNTKFRTEQQKEVHKTIWRRLLGKAMLTNREAQALMGFFKK